MDAVVRRIFAYLRGRIVLPSRVTRGIEAELRLEWCFIQRVATCLFGLGLPMLTELTISNFAIIERQSLSFHSGFNVISGETGAGKSILLHALE